MATERAKRAQSDPGGVCDQVLHPSYRHPRLRLGVIHALIMQRQGYTRDARVAEGQLLKRAFLRLLCAAVPPPAAAAATSDDSELDYGESPVVARRSAASPQTRTVSSAAHPGSTGPKAQALSKIPEPFRPLHSCPRPMAILSELWGCARTR